MATATSLVVPPETNPTTTVTCLATATITSSTNLGPLTTPVAFPSICSNQFDFPTTILGQSSWSSLLLGGCALSQCCPSSRFYTSDNAWYSSYFSPGVCPQGYQTCNGPAEVETILPAGESVRFCCPLGYTCPMWPCFSICATLRASATTALVVDNIVHQSIYSTETLSAQTGVSTAYDYAYPIQIRWKDSDFAVQTSSSALPAGTSSGFKSGIGNKKLSTGTIAAIAVVVAVLALASLILAVWWFRKRGKAKAGPVATEINVAVGEKPEMDGSGMAARELDTNHPVYELETRKAVG
ncbi:hypothetical protein ONS96_009321 [Cadophora gregata f. sp. sojae]|nr:hypothetical protein ONS96_009321 [Cadophora gregata f. sp. sojae]